ncbi:hypothetical protein WCE01_15770, partial [Acinetobacter indicus]|uniref:hypothetical protein n=1 Tax=Acinetobacter indicus TaxID=756892 RepID=UPI0034D79FD9
FKQLYKSFLYSAIQHHNKMLYPLKLDKVQVNYFFSMAEANNELKLVYTTNSRRRLNVLLILRKHKSN